MKDKQLKLFGFVEPKKPKPKLKAGTPARFTGNCKLCGRLYNRGTLIVFYGNNKHERPWVHHKCYLKVKGG